MVATCRISASLAENLKSCAAAAGSFAGVSRAGGGGGAVCRAMRGATGAKDASIQRQIHRVIACMRADLHNASEIRAGGPLGRSRPGAFTDDTTDAPSDPCG